MSVIDINADVGEIEEYIFGGLQDALLPYLTSVNVACGGHAGDERTMRATVAQARRYGVAVGAHPGYPDRENFGRLRISMARAALAESVYLQVSALAAITANVHHVKPHGALYNGAAQDAWVARAIADGVARWSRDVVLVGLAGSVMLDVFREEGFTVAAEAFADRRYERDGRLRSRQHADALINDPKEAAQQAARIAFDHTVTAVDGSAVRVAADTLCIHSDTPGAVEIAAAVQAALVQRQ